MTSSLSTQRLAGSVVQTVLAFVLTLYLAKFTLLAGDKDNRFPHRLIDCEVNPVFQVEAGTWDTTTKLWPNGNLAAPKIYKGTEKNEVSSDGRHVHRTYEGPLLKKALHEEVGYYATTGDEFRLSYNAKTKQFTGRWNDKDADEELGRLEGSYDETTKILTMIRNPRSEIEPEVRYVTEYLTPNRKKFTVVYVQPANGRDFLFSAVEIIANRRKQ